MTSPDWTTFSDDPNNNGAKAAVRAWLPTARRVHDDIDMSAFIENLVRGKTVLDVGVAAHSLSYIERPDWRHGIIRRAAAHCLGIDILAPLVKELAARGFNVRCVDATSEDDLGERFDVVFIGDVIEHVNDVVALLRFAARHLAPSGRIYATTPNPFSRKFIRLFFRERMIVTNLDHVTWITPTMAMEVARRAGLRLFAYHFAKRYAPITRILHRIAWRFSPVDYAFPDFIYEFGSPDADTGFAQTP
jgi:2-polyprenyl-3-methyl-5-hydroxy-6-metoxy-1,4-benzoquinol methylase